MEIKFYVVFAQLLKTLCIEGYSFDEAVVDYCVNELRHEKYPFNIMRFDGFSALGKNYKDHPRLVAALDEWVQKQEYRDVEVSQASRVGRTDIFKKGLMESLYKSFPHWPADALLDGWGMDDPEVSVALLSIVNGPADKASGLGHLIPKIIADRSECRKRLIEILKDPDCKRYDFVMSGLVDLGNCDGDSEVVDIALAVLGVTKDVFSIDTFTAYLIRHYSFDPRVRQLALETLDKREAPFSAIAHAFENDAEIRARILKIATPLPSRLRQIIARYLSDAEIDDGFAKSVLKYYDHERDGEIVTVHRGVSFEK